MATIRFKDRYRQQILAGDKVQTLRAKLPAGIQVGARAYAASSYSRPAWAELEINEIRTITLDDLDDTVAQADGYADAETLRADLARLYPGVEQLVAIGFRCLGAPAQRAAAPSLF